MSANEGVSVWLNENLSQILSFPVPQDLIQYIMTIENERDIDDYMKTLLDFSNPSHKQFCNNYKVIRHIKSEKEDDKKKALGKKDKKVSGSLGKKAEKASSSEKEVVPLLEKLSFDQREGTKGGKKKKNHYVNLYSDEGAGRDVVMLKGRHHCDCQASKHRLVNNCLNCGRVVCAQEGSGPCLFCGTLVCSKEEQEFINAKTAQSQKLYDNLMEGGRPQGWEEAIAQRDRLLEYDRTTQSRTKVIDDEGEYFSASSVWLSPQERDKMAKREEEMRRRKHASRLEAKFTLDFAGRQVVEDSASFQELCDEEEEEEDYRGGYAAQSGGVVNPDVALKWRPEFIPDNVGKRVATVNPGGSKSKVQDRQLLEMSDEGVCLSMHQPWASLLVHGVKRHEGRNWYSSHRGRLWIAAASKQPSEEEIKEVEHFHRLIRQGEILDMPISYPTSCLLGCVTVVDVLSQEDYQVNFDRPESESPFVFICDDPKPLSLKFPMAGQHKIYKLDPKIHEAAKKALLRMLRSEG